MNKKHSSIVNQHFFIYEDNDNVKINVVLLNADLWLTQDLIAELFGTARSTVTEHINNILKEGELSEASSVGISDQSTGGRKPKIYNLDMIIAVGYRVNSKKATNFRIWATQVLKDYMIKGFALNDERLKNNGVQPYFEELLARIRDIRSSEKVFWRKVLDIYATSVDYDPKNQLSIDFFKTIQNKMHYATHGKTAAELIFDRVDSQKENLGLTNFLGKIPTKSDTEIAKNYLTEEELNILNRMVSAYLDIAELNALDKRVMTMQDWSNELDSFLKMTKKDILNNSGTISHDRALKKAHKEYDKYMQKHLSVAEQDYLEILSKKVEDLNK